MKGHGERRRWRTEGSAPRAQRSADAHVGSATAELVVLLPAVGALLVAVLAGAQAVVANAAVVDASAAAARLAARGDPVDAALARFSSSGRAVHVASRQRDAFLCVTVGIGPQPGVLISLPAEAESCVLAAG